MKSVNSQPQINPQPWEISIPGIPGYTIDRDMQCRSWLGAQPVDLKMKLNHHGGYCYNLTLRDANGLSVRRSFSPIRLYLCAQAGVSPLDNSIDSFKVDQSGAIVLRTRVNQTGAGRKVTTTRISPSPEQMQLDTLERLQREQEAQIRAVRSGDWGEMLLLMQGYQRVAILHTCANHRVTLTRAEQIFPEAINRTLRAMQLHHRPVSNVMGRVLKEMKIIIARNEIV